MEKIFWQDYFLSLGDAINRLREVLAIDDNTIDSLPDATIQRFKFTIELFWKVLKKFLSYEKIDSTTPRNFLSKAYQYELIDNEKIWLAMLYDRNNTSHMYKQEDARKVFLRIKEYFPSIESTYQKLQIKFEKI
jgi:nucleotidyltransferase substrate binding protein (TIGR01987 family)